MLRFFVFTLLMFFGALPPAWAQGMRKQLENPPRLSGIQYRWCQPLTERQIRQREKWGTPFARKTGREEGKRLYGSRIGKWTFWDDQGRKMAQGECRPQPAMREGFEHGLWTYWDEEGRRIEMNWTYGKFDGTWTLFDPRGTKRWQFELHDEQKRKELFSDTVYLKAEGLWREPQQKQAQGHLFD